MTQKQINKYRGSLLLTIEEAKRKNYKTICCTAVACLNEFDKILSENTLPNVEADPDIYDMSDAD